MKYESNTPMFSKDIAWKPFFVRTYMLPPPIINGGAHNKICKQEVQKDS